MYKDSFIRLNEPIEATDSLIRHTVMAAEQRAGQKRLPAWPLVSAMAASLILVAGMLFLAQPAPQDLVASNGEFPGSTEGFIPLASQVPTTSAPTATPQIHQTDASRLHESFVQELLAEKAPDLADEFLPVGLCTEHDGITFEVIAACLNEGNPVILSAYTGEQLDALTTQSISLDAGLFSQYKQLQGYDEASHTMYIITVVERGKTMSPGDQINISLYNIGFHTPYTYTVHGEIDLASMSFSPATQSKEVIRYDYPEKMYQTGGTYYIPHSETTTTVLVPSEPLVTFPDGAMISAAGVIGGKLHIQICCPIIRRRFINDGREVSADGSGSLSLTLIPRAAEQFSNTYLDYIESNMHWSDENNGFSYMEYVLRIPINELGNYALRTSYQAPGEYIGGEWKLTFTLPAP